MAETTGVGAWLTLTFRDAERMLAWLRAIGFTEHAVYRSGDDQQGVVGHAELLWPGGGGVMAGSYREGGEWPSRPGTGAAYLVTDDTDGVYEAAIAAGATSLYAPRDQSYGGRGAGVRDPEGNLWSFGSYRP